MKGEESTSGQDPGSQLLDRWRTISLTAMPRALASRSRVPRMLRQHLWPETLSKGYGPGAPGAISDLQYGRYGFLHAPHQSSRFQLFNKKPLSSYF